MIAIGIVRENPGIGTTKLRTLIKARSGCGSAAADVAIARITGDGEPVYVKTEGKTEAHYIREGMAVTSADTKHVVNGASSMNGIGMVVDEENPLDNA